MVKNNHEMKKMVTVIVSRHQASINYLKHLCPEAEVKKQLTKEDIVKMSSGTIVVGDLPLQLIAELNAMGILYFAIEFDSFPPRGEELDHEEIKKYGIRITQYSVKKRIKTCVTCKYSQRQRLQEPCSYCSIPLQNDTPSFWELADD